MDVGEGVTVGVTVGPDVGSVAGSGVVTSVPFALTLTISYISL